MPDERPDLREALLTSLSDYHRAMNGEVGRRLRAAASRKGWVPDLVGAVVAMLDQYVAQISNAAATDACDSALLPDPIEQEVHEMVEEFSE